MLVFLPGEREIRDAHLRAVAAQVPRDRNPAAVRAPVGAPSRTACSSRARSGASCSRRTSPKPRSRCRASATSSTPASRASSATAQRNKVERLHIEPISQAARRPARGPLRARRPGICIRLYGEDDFARAPRYTDPEILRSSLAAVILRMLALKLGDVDDFPFLEAPSERAIADGYRRLAELGAHRCGRSALTDDRPHARETADRRRARAHARRSARSAARCASCWCSRRSSASRIRASARRMRARPPTRRMRSSPIRNRISSAC